MSIVVYIGITLLMFTVVGLSRCEKVYIPASVIGWGTLFYINPVVTGVFLALNIGLGALWHIVLRN